MPSPVIISIIFLKIFIVSVKMMSTIHTGANKCIRVESGSDDRDNLGNLGHFFGGSSGSHPQTKLSVASYVTRISHVFRK